MDPLSLAASIAGLLSLAASVVSTGYKLKSRMSKNVDDLAALLNETAGFSGILLAVKAHLESKPSILADPESMGKMLAESRNTLDEIAALLEKLSTANRLMLLVTSEGREERLEKLFKRIEQYKLFFILCFHLDSSSQTETIHVRMTEIVDNLKTLNQSQERVEKAVEKLVDEEQVKHREKVIQWLGLVTEEEHSDLCERRDSTSCEWILNRDEFGSWLSSQGSSFFWLNGIQGSGKSVIVSKIVTAIQETHVGLDGSALGYHYCRFSHSSTLSPSQVVGSFIGQLLRQSSDQAVVMKVVTELYEKHQTRSTHPSFDELQAIFVDISQYFSRIFLVIDGLDEMPDRWSILDFLENLSEIDGDFKVLVASRAEMDLENAFSFYCTITVTPDDITPDIERFVRAQFTKRRFRGTQVDDIVQELVARADGMFLWVVCQVDYLSSIRTRVTPAVLKALPRNLERTFEQTFLKLPEEDRVIAKRILQFVMMSNNPLDLAELIDGIAITADTRCLADVKQNTLARETDVFDLCGSLVRQSQATGKIELAHYSVYTFLKSAYLEGNRPNEIHIVEAQGNIELLMACARYLSMKDVCNTGLPAEVEEALADDDTYVNPEIFATTPFLEHATNNWPIYISRIAGEPLDDVWKTVLLPFFQPSEDYFNFWVKISRYIHGQHKYPRYMTPLHAVALHGLPRLAQFLMTDPSLGNAPWQPSHRTWGYKTPLHTAIENGQEEMIETFLIPSYIHSADEKVRTPLHIALESGDEVVAMQLITVGANVNSPDIDGRTPIFIAIENTWEDPAAMLSEMADPKLAMRDGRELLHVAAQTGSTAWTSALLEFHSDHINAVDQSGWTPLLYAIDRGFADVAKTLLSKGACIGIEDKNGWTPLHAAMRHKHLDCANQILTSKNQRYIPSHTGVGASGTGFPIDISQQDPALMAAKYGTASRDNASSGDGGGSSSSTQTVPPLPPLIFSQSSTVSSPLLVAVSNNFIPGVELLLKHAEEHGRGIIGLLENDGSCLKMAKSLPDAALFAMLLPVSTLSSIVAALPEIAAEKDEKVITAMRQKLDVQFIHQSLLPQIIKSKAIDIQVANFLLDCWPPARETLPEDILHVVARCLFSDQGSRFATRLIEGGAQKFHESPAGCTSLREAIQSNNWDVAQVFITNDMLYSQEVPNALHDLIENVRYEGDDTEKKVLKTAGMLLNAGVEINGVDLTGRTICQKAATEINSTLLKWALENNASPAQADPRGDTAVSVAIAFAHTENLRLLLNAIIQTMPDELVRIFASSGVRKPAMIAATDLRNIEILTALIEADQMAATVAEDIYDPAHQSMRLSVFTNALCNAIRNGFDHGVLQLIEAMDDVSCLSSTGETPLHVAVRQENEGVVRILLERGAQPNAQVAESGESLLGIAMNGKMHNIIPILSEYGAIYQEGDIMAAAKSGNEEIVRRVMEMYPNDLRGQMKALFMARNDRQHNTESILLQKAASLWEPAQIEGIVRDAYGDTKLHQAVRCKNPEQVETIGSTGGRGLLDAKDMRGDSALMLAIRLGHWAKAEALARAGADIQVAINRARSEHCGLWVEKLTDLQTRHSGMR
ncbi:hypothetical protein BKA56DRAFT_591345 [Ilyonectria sp. MPI-CAGE-AT-0026]|nr:hypothetical protein BKA56DRAFT_591345 [Ilyonectria sp. MPI-CAGE-AT-0026]